MLSEAAWQIVRRLNGAGYEAFAVGGCVRDMLRGAVSSDVDIATSARPEQVCALFGESRVVPTGIRHGTVTVLAEGASFEVTSYRRDGVYSDARRPDDVTFGVSLTDDLRRRDFTVNAMAFHPDTGLIDPFGGREDVQKGVLRCVGEPKERFREDPLRILRLLRFASVLGFEIDSATGRAAREMRHRLALTAAERKRDELFALMCGDHAGEVLLDYPEVLFELIPSLSPALGFDQRNPHHDFDLFTHSVRAVSFTPPTLTLRLAALLHDMGKPRCMTIDENGVGHFYGHAAVSAEMAKEALLALRADRATVLMVESLVAHHDAAIEPTKRCVRRRMAHIGEETMREELLLKEADARACRKNPPPGEWDGLFRRHTEVRRLMEEIRRDGDCLTLADLAVNGDDVMACGVPQGKAVGEILRTLLSRVIDGQRDNTRDALLAEIRENWL